MKIVLVGPAYPHRGGIAQYTASLYRCLCHRHEVQIISFSRLYPGFLFPGRTQHDVSRSGLRVPCEPMLDSVSPWSWSEVAERVNRYQPAVVVFQWWQPFFGLAYHRIIRRIRDRHEPAIVLLCHNIYSHEKSWIPGVSQLEQILTLWAFRSAEGFLVHAEDLKPLVRRLNPRGLVRRIYHPLYDFYREWDPVDGRVTSGPERTHDKAHLLFFGKVRRYKGLRTFLEALALVKHELDFIATVAGEFYMNPQPYRALANRLGLDSHVIWEDRYIPNEEVPPLFRSADLVVLPYVEATQSGVVPLAYQFEVPVIATDVGGLSEVVEQGVTGYLVPPGNSAALAAKILEYFKTDRKQLFQRNILEFRKRLTWQQVAEGIEELTRQLHLSGDERGSAG